MSQEGLRFTLIALLIGGAVLFYFAPDRTVGGVVLGAGLTLGVAFVIEQSKRNQLRRDLAAVLHHELANRVARCYLDFEAPWRGYSRSTRVNKFGAAKFAPLPPIVFEANADKLAMFDDAITSKLISFYFRLAVLERDIQSARSESPSNDIDPSFVPIIRSRLAATLVPGLAALEALGPLVANRLQIEADALASLKAKGIERREVSLREGLAKEIANGIEP